MKKRILGLLLIIPFLASCGSGMKTIDICDTGECKDFKDRYYISEYCKEDYSKAVEIGRYPVPGHWHSVYMLR